MIITHCMLDDVFDVCYITLRNYNCQTEERRMNEIIKDKTYDLLVLGAGPAGMNAAMYASRKGLDVLVLSLNRGGQLNDTAMIENYLGTESILGYELAEKFAAHLEKYKVPVAETANVIEYRRKGTDHEVVLSDGDVYRGKTVVIATGSVYRSLNVQGEWDFVGKGVSYCAICDAPLFRNKNVLVAGGGNSAAEAALDLSKYAKSVTILH
ncbi:FAD-binding protein, partial [Candidatus Nomurabacteria bacterium]|nr:FAD-binding protein [Candidatus Nomurabacteria bacterium]